MPMVDSKMTDEWLRAACAANPPQPVKVKDPATGQITDSATNFLSGPVRLSFCHLFEPHAPPASADNPTPKATFNSNILFPPPSIIDLRYGVLRDAYNMLAYKHWPEYWDAGAQTFVSLYSPFRDQRELAVKKYQGFQPGSFFMSPSSAYKPRVIDTAQQDIIDPKQVYAGMWAIVELNVHAIGLKSGPGGGIRKKGVNFGLASVMIIAPDTNLEGGGASDPRAWATGVQLPVGTDMSAAFVQAPVGTVPGGPPGPSGPRPGGLPPMPGAPPSGHLPPPPAVGMSSLPPGYGAPPAISHTMPPAPGGGLPFDPRRPVGMTDAAWLELKSML